MTTPTTEPETDELITKLELAKKLKVTTKTIEDWVKARRIPAIKMARAVRFSWPDVKAALVRFTTTTK